jgi:hypothetical protein
MRRPSTLHLCVLPVLSGLALLTACASQSPEPPTATGSAPETLAAPAHPTTLELLRQGGAFMFSLDESDPATMWHERCARESGGDAAKAAACYAHVREVGSHEGIRFSVDAEQRIVLTSFGQEDGKDAIYLEGPLTLAPDGDHAVIGNFATTPHGLQMEGKSGPPQKPVRIELTDGKTMVMVDEAKGRLVFHRVGE